mmetsp:Transcript_14631/g.19550  ORF Transcript_14631/g.19550 Transcript_14631/m.19550 type:complete len:204 (+) Transcript_14631:377-988(+)
MLMDAMQKSSSSLKTHHHWQYIAVKKLTMPLLSRITLELSLSYAVSASTSSSSSPSSSGPLMPPPACWLIRVPTSSSVPSALPPVAAPIASAAYPSLLNKSPPATWLLKSPVPSALAVVILSRTFSGGLWSELKEPISLVLSRDEATSPAVAPATALLPAPPLDSAVSFALNPYIPLTSNTTSIMSEQSSTLCISTGLESVLI